MFYKNPVMIVNGKYQYLYDEKEKRYLDFFSGIATVGIGHCHPRIDSVIEE